MGCFFIRIYGCGWYGVRVIPAHECYDQLWGKGGTYYDYRFNELVVALERARISGVGSRGWPDDESHRSVRVGKQLKEWLEERI